MNEDALAKHVLRILSASAGIESASIRVSDVHALSGGVQGVEPPSRLTLAVSLVAKIGDQSLLEDAGMMAHVNSHAGILFPSVLKCEAVEGHHVLVMSFVDNMFSVHKEIFGGHIGCDEAEKLAVEAVSTVSSIHSTPLWREPSISDPYTRRLRNKINEAIARDTQLADLWTSAIEVGEELIPNLSSRLEQIERWASAAVHGWRFVTLHGDPHIGNLLCSVRPDTKVRPIDPNSAVSPGDVVYDAGKLIHWASAVGWAAFDPSAVTCEVRRRSGRIALCPLLNERARADIEYVRQCYESATRAAIASRLQKSELERLPLSTATAHVGLARLLAIKKSTEAARFCVATALSELAKFNF